MKNNDNSNERSQYEKIGEKVSIYKRGGKWWMNYQDLDGIQQRKSLRTTSKKQARVLAFKKDSELMQNKEPDIVKIATIEEAIAIYDDFLVTQDSAVKTLSKYRRLFRQVQELALKRRAKDMRAVNLSFFDAFQKMRKTEGCEPITIHNDLVIIRQLVNFALRRDMIDKDRLKALKLKRPKAKEQPFWKIEVVYQILEATKGALTIGCFAFSPGLPCGLLRPNI